MKKKIVSKFGGTSMGDASCMLRSAEISLNRGSNIVVVSATSGSTNDLIKMGDLAKQGDQSGAEQIYTKLIQKHNVIGTELKITSDKQNLLNQLYEEMKSLAQGIYLLRDCSDKAKDVLQSIGERLSSVLFTQAMENKSQSLSLKNSIQLLDVRLVLKTDDNFGKAKPLTSTIKNLCEEHLAGCYTAGIIYVTQGFIGQTLSGATTTLGRGGSDYSAAILAEGIKADTLEIWTDVAGVSTTDPRIFSDALVIKDISFKEMSELATFGAKVLHPATLLPAIRAQIPVLVASSFEPEKEGTWVRKEVESSPLIRAMALRKKQTLVTLSTPEMLYSHGFLFQIFKVFNDYKISIDAITTSEISVSVTLDNMDTLSTKLIEDLSQIADVQIEKDLCLVSLIGNNINHTPGLARQIFSAISDINVRMICYGASKHNFCFLVNEDKGSEVIQKLHKQFI